MANSLCSYASAIKSPPNSGTKTGGIIIGNSVASGRVLRINQLFGNSGTNDGRPHSLQLKASEKGGQSTKMRSIVCKDCEGNGAIQCNQCLGTGVNSVDHFNGQFKAGGLCWLCRGKREILCGSCNGAGFIGGFMSTFDD